MIKSIKHLSIGPFRQLHYMPLLTLLWLTSAAAEPVSERTQTPAAPDVAVTPALDLGAFSTVQEIIPHLADVRIVLIGEQHTRYDHHLVQLDIIRHLHRQNPRLAIGLEMFQQPFQRHLDDYVAGTIDEQAMLRATEYHERWRMDYRMYAPILRYAREHRLPLVALNVPVELTRQVGRVGFDGLTVEERNALPTDIQSADAAYERRVRDVFDYHPNENGQDFAHFLEVQLLWDEGMAERAATYLQANPDQRMVILAGNAHLAHGSAIPDRLTRRSGASIRVILNDWSGAIEPGLADFLLFPVEQELPTTGKFGALLEQVEDSLVILSCTDDSPCANAGIHSGDRITSIDQAAISSMADLRLAMWDKQPGDQVQLDIQRKRWFGGEKTLSYQLTLQ